MPSNRNNQEIFNQIAPAWYNYRHWSIFSTELEALVQRWQQGRLLNIGCAHGPDFLPFAGLFELHGVDFSVEMLKLAEKYAAKFGFNVSLALAEATRLPYADGSFDWAIAVATYHHLMDKDSQQKAFRELWRVLKPGGEAFITVWNRWQPRFWFKGKQTLIPWRTGNDILLRRYYLFSYHELERLASKAGFQVLSSFPETAYRGPLKLFSRNICLLVKRIR